MAYITLDTLYAVFFYIMYVKCFGLCCVLCAMQIEEYSTHVEQVEANSYYQYVVEMVIRSE